MQLASIQEVKATIRENIPPTRSLGLGRAKKGKENILAVRVYGQNAWWKNKLEWLHRTTCGEVEVKFVGPVSALPCEPVSGWQRQRTRPLQIGLSVSHGQVTAGTLGCFVKDTRDRYLLLSNNHVIACSNNASKGDAICQPGTYDGGDPERDTIASLAEFVRIHDKDNLVDAATAVLKNSREGFLPNHVHSFERIHGKFQGTVEPGDLVGKFGRTTGDTLGRVTAVEVDNVGVGYQNGVKYFNSQIEIEGAEDVAFCRGGDSGSVVFTAPDGRKGDHYVLGLLFAAGNRGGQNNQGLTYVNYLDNVLEALKLQLVY